MMIDLIIGAVILISALVAFFRGFIREVLTILGVIGGLVAAYMYGATLAPFYNGLLEGDKPAAEGAETPHFMGIIPYPLLSEILGYATVFLGVVIILSILSYFLSKFVENVGMGMLDRTLGVAFGIARGVILLGVLYMPIHMFADEEEKKNWFKDSHLQVYIEATSEWLSEFLPEDFLKDTGQEKLDQTRETLKALDILPEVAPFSQPSADPKGQNAAPPASATPLEPAAPAEGYDQPQRQSMEDLIEQQEKPVND
ncbi:MAG: CvpA family protein [Rhodospirillales bacterium]|nr:CvpA family protein [Rhodospirillales bacterium]MCB9980563.1 CvpA family protein [Rhodospirillales bacterium]